MDIIKRFVLNEKVKMIVNTTWDFNKCLKLFFYLSGRRLVKKRLYIVIVEIEKRESFNLKMII